MTKEYEIRASFNKETLIVYQAYSKQIAEPAVREQKFVSPFSFHRMTWIKPSFLWLMHRSNWGKKPGQEKTLAIHIKRTAWDTALSKGVLTHPEPKVYSDPPSWKKEFDNALVHVQWDPERSLRGNRLNYYSIQVGISRHLIEEYVSDWIVKIEDLSPKVSKIHSFLKSGNEKNAKRQLPEERVYPLDRSIGMKILVE